MDCGSAQSPDLRQTGAPLVRHLLNGCGAAALTQLAAQWVAAPFGTGGPDPALPSQHRWRPLAAAGASRPSQVGGMGYSEPSSVSRSRRMTEPIARRQMTEPIARRRMTEPIAWREANQRN